jgi:hypothetical protein
MQLDGPDLEELLVRARHEYGSDVRIVKADKVRVGGVGGFFAREHYELSVEVDELPLTTQAIPAHSPFQAQAQAQTPPQRTTISRPVSLLDLADAISDREVETRQGVGRSAASTHPSKGLSLQSYSPSGLTGDDDDDEVTFTPGLPTSHLAPAPSSGPALSTDGASFASILAGLTESVAERPAPAPKPIVVPEPEAVVAVRPVIVEQAVERPTPKTPARTQRAAVAQQLSLRDLRDVGLPSDLLPARADGDLLGVLVAALRALPKVPEMPSGPGDIFAVVGEGEAAWDAGVQLARSLDLDERSVVYVTAGHAPAKVAPARRITAIDQLSTRADRWRKRTTPTVAVVDAPMTVKAARWNRQALATLDAEAVWLVVPATRKTDDVAKWASRLGRADGLVVTDVDASSDPASVLQLGFPVAWLDGRPATPGAWAGLIVDRLVEAR